MQFFIFYVNSEKHTVGVCIVDEAAQILELDTLKVLPFKEKTLVLLGDICKNPTNHDNVPVRFYRLYFFLSP